MWLTSTFSAKDSADGAPLSAELFFDLVSLRAINRPITMEKGGNYYTFQ